MVLNGQEPGRHLLDDALYLDLNTVLNKQGSGRRILVTRYIADWV
jgi:hypothetical protein